MENKMNYIFPILFTFVLIIVSSCRSTTDDLAYYYNSTGAGNDNSCCCGGCCDNDNSSTSDIATPFCEPEVPTLAGCDEDGTLEISGYKGLTFAAQGECPDNQYISIKDGIMTIGAGQKLLNSDGKQLLWIEEGSSTITGATIPENVESIVVLPDATVIGYVEGVATTLGKLITVVLQVVGECANRTEPLTSVGHSVLWCGERVCSSVVSGTVVRSNRLATLKVNIPSGSYMTLKQNLFESKASSIYITGVKDIAITDQGYAVERITCMPVVDTDGLDVIVPTVNVSELEVSSSAELMINGGVWAKFSVAVPQEIKALASLSLNGLTGYKVSSKEGEVPIMIPVEREVGSIETGLNVCVQDPLGLK